MGSPFPRVSARGSEEAAQDSKAMANAQEAPPPRWHAPQEGVEERPEECLRLFNSLVDGKVRRSRDGEAVWERREADESLRNAPLLHTNVPFRQVPFVPAKGRGSKVVSWYICGPTVYDSAHVGHARNYVTFDIVRRILEDYFGYNVVYVMNVTDIDDKIILRARRNHLLDEYKQEVKGDLERVLSDCQAALRQALEKQQAMVFASMEAAAGEPEPKRRDELEVVAKQESLKLEKLRKSQDDLETQSNRRCLEGMIDTCSDALAVMLDKTRGKEVTDHSIFKAHASRYEEEFMEDMESLGVRPPTVLTRVSEYMEEIVHYVEKIICNGLGYVSNGSVYFSTQAYQEAGHRYGKLRPWAVGSSTLASEGEVGGDFATMEKRHPNDFALWKASKPGEPSWDSPWGKGRPGWHIECSAMASSILGMNIDIHTGGEDLKFPHHDNELAQAEAYYHCEGCRQWVNYFLHSGHLGIEGLKMSKSLKNFVTIRQALEETSARQLRLLFVMQPWERAMSYSATTMSEVRARETLLKNFYQNVEVAKRMADKAGQASTKRWSQLELSLQASLEEVQARVHERLQDNLDTRGAMDALCDLVKQTNIYLSGRGGSDALPQSLLLDSVERYVSRILSCFGLAGGLSFASTSTSERAQASHQVAPWLDAFASFRDEIRSIARGGGDASRILSACDRLRDETLVDLGIRLEDKANGSVWKLDDPAALRLEVEEKRRTAREAERLKAARKVAAKAKEIAKWERLSASPRTALSDRYSAFDADENPTHDVHGDPLDGKQLDKAKKEADKIRKQRAQYMDKEAQEPGFLDELRSERDQLVAQVEDVSLR